MILRVFVVGVQRSGTTHVANVLSSHPDCKMLVNGKIFYLLNVWALRDSSPALSGHLRLDEVAHSLRRMPIRGVDQSVAARIVERIERGFDPALFDGRSREEIVRHVWDHAMAEAGDARVIGEKYNEYTLLVREIAGVFPDARFVMIHRNPADVARSMVRRFQGRCWCPATVVDAVRKWATWNAEWMRAERTLPAGHALEMAYDDVAGAPRREFGRLCEFLGLPAEAEFLDMAERSTRRSETDAGAPAIDWGSVRRTAPAFPEICARLGYRELASC